MVNENLKVVYRYLRGANRLFMTYSEICDRLNGAWYNENNSLHLFRPLEDEWSPLLITSAENARETFLFKIVQKENKDFLFLKHPLTQRVVETILEFRGRGQLILKSEEFDVRLYKRPE